MSNFSLRTHSTVKAQTLNAVGSAFHLQNPASPGLEQAAAWSTSPHHYKSASLDVLGTSSQETSRNISTLPCASSCTCAVSGAAPSRHCPLGGRTTLWKKQRRREGVPKQQHPGESGAVPAHPARATGGSGHGLGSRDRSGRRGSVGGSITHPLCCGKGSAACGWHLRLLLSHR